MSKEEGKGLTFFLFLSRRHRCPLFFFLILFFAFRIFFSCFFCDVFLVIPVQIRFQSNGSDISLARPPIEPLTGTDSVDGTFFDFSVPTCFQSDRADIGLARSPIVVLTGTNVPCRHIHPKCTVSV